MVVVVVVVVVAGVVGVVVVVSVLRHTVIVPLRHHPYLGCVLGMPESQAVIWSMKVLFFSKSNDPRTFCFSVQVSEEKHSAAGGWQ